MSVEERAPVLLHERKGAVLKLTMHRPASYNALDDELKDVLLKALKSAASDAEVRCVVLTGSGKAFSSGQDLREAAIDAPEAVGMVLRQKYNPIARILHHMEKPVIAAINGAAAGAGLSLALVCDVRLMADSAKLNLAFTNIGLVPDCGACFTLPQLIGRAATLEIAYTGRVLDAAEALRLGLVTKVVPHAEFESVVDGYAAILAARPTKVLGLTKRAINRAMIGTLDDTLEYEALCQEIAVATTDAREGITAFRDKRAAVFVGR